MKIGTKLSKLFLLATVLAGLVVAVAAESATGHPPTYPGDKYCGSFRAKPLRIYVYANSHLTCTKSMRVQQAFWRGKTTYHSCSPACGYTTLKRYPGWRCNTGGGGGDCRKRNKVSHYESRFR